MTQYDQFFELLKQVNDRGFVLTDNEEEALCSVVERAGMYVPLKRLAECDVQSVLLIVEDELAGVRYSPQTVDGLVNTYRQARMKAVMKAESDRYVHFQKQ